MQRLFEVTRDGDSRNANASVRVEIPQASADERFAKTTRMGEAPRQWRRYRSDAFKLARRPQPNARGGKKRVVIAPQLVLPQIQHPLNHNPANVIAHWEEESGEGLAEF